MTANVAELEAHRTALTGHCYRMLGSVVDADDAVQETLVRAWKGLERFDGRASLRTWLTRIATHVCIDALSERARRAHPTEEGPAGTVDDPLETRPRTHWLEPVADARVLPRDADPAERAALRQSIRLAFVAALQHLPPRQRAALLLTEVLGFSAAEAAETLETSVASLNSALQRARATLAARGEGLELERAPLSETQSELLDRYVEAFERYDVEALTSLLRKDVVMSMPPFTLWLQGRDAIAAWLLGRGAGCRGSRVVKVEASGLPAIAQYRQGGREPWALCVLEPVGGEIARMTFFLDTETLFPHFGLPAELPA